MVSENIKNFSGKSLQRGKAIVSRKHHVCCFNRLMVNVLNNIKLFSLTWGYSSSALTCRTCYAVPPGELHVWELGYVLPSTESIQRLIVGVPVLSLPPRALPVREERQAAAASRPPRPHGDSTRLWMVRVSFTPTTARLQASETEPLGQKMCEKKYPLSSMILCPTIKWENSLN